MVIKLIFFYSGYQDPFTGGSRYVPGGSNPGLNSAGNVDPFTGGSSYSTQQKGFYHFFFFFINSYVCDLVLQLKIVVLNI